MNSETTLDGRPIDLTEPEAALASHPGVADAAAAVLGDAIDQQLVGYVVAAGEPPGSDELHAYLAAALPEPLLPALVVVLDRIPRTADGTPDRNLLAAATRGEPADAAAPSIVAGVAADVADMWREVLRVDSVGLGDDLFDLGGHSLSITRITVRIRARLGVEVPLTVFYDTPTIPGIAAAVEEIRRSGR